ncbi:MAG: M42 family metallopeptidase [Phycisphaerae bacterium]|nr:M42 family metallopeptidase [Phycisphaerae bacterium]
MKPESFDFLRQIEEAPSVSGFEQPVARIVRARMSKWADRIETDVHGNVIVMAGEKAGPRVMLAGHMDQIGLMVKYVSDEGYIYFDAVGGIDNTVLPGSRLTIHTKNGPVEGVIGRKPIHLMKPEERNQGKVERTDLWIDIGSKNKNQTLKRVQIGDPVTYRLGLTRIGDDFIASPGLDNKVGTWVVMEALRLAVETKKLRCALYAVATVQEEIGLRGAQTACFGIDPKVGIAVDVTHATDNPGAEKKVAGECRLGGGAVVERGPNINPPLFDLIVSTARKKKLPIQMAAAPRGTGTDANIMQLTRAGVATALISIPNRYMHTQVEMCSLSDLQTCAELLAETVLRIDGRTRFIPE